MATRPRRFTPRLAALLGLSLFAAAVAALPPVPQPSENPTTEAKRVLGKILFWDEQLSSDNTASCASCHTPERGGTDAQRVRTPGPDGQLNTPDDIFGSPGVINADSSNHYLPALFFDLNRQVTTRAANSPINAAYATDLFWDGRARTTFVDPQTGQVAIASGGGLESQAVGPPLNSVEMAHAGRDWNQIAAKLRVSRPLAVGTDLPADVAAAIQAHRTYPNLFANAFGDPAITARRIAFAIAAYERTLIADDTPWDRTQAGLPGGMTPQQAQGFNAFQASNCAVCHTPPHFTDHSFRNIGLRPPAEDPGRQNVTNNPADRGRFKVPSLRNAGLRTTLMHNGVFTNIGQVVGFYARAPGAPPQFPENRDPIMPAVNVPPQVAPLIIDFVTNALTDARVANAQFPFDHPTLFAERPADQAQVVAPGVAGSGGIVPRILANAPSVVGDTGFRLGLDDARGGAGAMLAVSTQPPVGGRVVPQQLVGPFTAGGAGDGNGFATAMWPIPANPALQGRDVYFQWIVSDPAAPGGEALSAAVRTRIFCGPAGCAPCPADWNRDAAVTSTDIADYLAAWISGISSGSFTPDVTGDQSVNSTDISAFLVTWLEAVSTGC